MITGNDELSIKILESYEQGYKVKDIPSSYPVSLDQAKRLSRYHKILRETEKELNTQSLEKIGILGLKALYLAPLFKSKDWVGLNKILKSINENTKRDELPKLIKSLQEKEPEISIEEIELENKEHEIFILEKQKESFLNEPLKISKIINNNVVSVIKSNKQEMIFMGRGIGFQMSLGDAIDRDKVEKTFILENKNLTEKLKKLLSEIPIECMEVSEEVIQYAKVNTGKKLNDSIYISLTDHIFFAIERQKKGMEIKNGLLWETKRIYKDEFHIGKVALKMIETKLGITLSEDEAAFIALHIVNAQLNEEFPNIINITKTTQEILNIVKYHFQIDLDEESLHYYRFVTHLKFFAQRLFHGAEVDKEDDFLYEIVKKKYAEAFKCTEKVKTYIELEHNYYLTNEEMLYLTIHIERVTQKK